MLPEIKKCVEKFLKEERGIISKNNIIRAGALIAAGSLISRPVLGCGAGDAGWQNALTDAAGNQQMKEGVQLKDTWTLCDTTFCKAEKAECAGPCGHSDGSAYSEDASSGGQIATLTIDTGMQRIEKTGLKCVNLQSSCSHNNHGDCLIDTGVKEESHNNAVTIKTEQQETLSATHSHSITEENTIVVRVGGGEFWQKYKSDCHCNFS